MADEVTNVYNREQVVVRMHWVDGKLELHEDFKVDDIQSKIV